MQKYHFLLLKKLQKYLKCPALPGTALETSFHAGKGQNADCWLLVLIRSIKY